MSPLLKAVNFIAPVEVYITQLLMSLTFWSHGPAASCQAAAPE
jgi:hypothetical protein